MIYAATASDESLVLKIKIVIERPPFSLKFLFFHEFIMSQVNIIVEGECAQREIFVNTQR